MKKIIFSFFLLAFLILPFSAKAVTLEDLLQTLISLQQRIIELLTSRQVQVASSTPTRAVCTKELKTCPDGTSVARQGPKCEFAKCSEVFEKNGLVITSPRPGEKVNLPVKIKGYVKNGSWGVNEGEAGTVRLVSASGKELGQAILKTTSDWLKFPTYFEATVGDREWISYLNSSETFLFFKSQAAKDDDVIKEVKMPVKIIIPSTTQGRKLFYIALEDNGKSGKKIGCNDSVVGIGNYSFGSSKPLTEAISLLLQDKRENLEETGLFNSLHWFEGQMRVDEISIDSQGLASIFLTGSYKTGGTCDTPRIKAQIEETALQFPTVKKVKIYFNGREFTGSEKGN